MDCDVAGRVTSYGVPGPAHTTRPPSPISHTTRTGVAVTVTDTPGTDTVDDCAAHDAASTHNQLSRFTTWSSTGFIAIAGAGNGRYLAASAASSAGSRSATNTDSALYSPSEPVHVFMNQRPGADGTIGAPFTSYTAWPGGSSSAVYEQSERPLPPRTGVAPDVPTMAPTPELSVKATPIRSAADVPASAITAPAAAATVAAHLTKRCTLVPRRE